MLSVIRNQTEAMLRMFRYDKLNRIKQMQTATLNGTNWGNPAYNFATLYSYDFNGNITSLYRNNAFQQTLHNIAYQYNVLENRLRSITATGLNSSSYQYDAVGNLTHDSGERLRVAWNAAGKVDTIRKGGSTLSVFHYSPTGQRQVKQRGDTTDYYLHDAAGNVMCIYTHKGDTLTAIERPFYGSKRLGESEQRFLLGPGGTLLSYDTATIGLRRYELTDHLGNVMAVYSDRKIGVDTDSDGYVNYYAPEIISVNDYYPFGYPIRERCFSREDYRYGFNDKENDNEVYEPSTFQDYGFRMYDTRVARFWGVDPLYRIYPWYSSYQFAGNKPVLFIDKDGQEEARREEIVHSLLHPLDALQVRNNAKKASTAAHNSNLPDARDGLQDAFRHAYWNALNARDIGALRAERFATIHEIGNTNEANNPNSFQYDPVAIEMDLFNNEIGRKLGAAYYNATDEELAALVMQALANGELKIITNIGASNIDKQLGESYHPNIEKGETVTPTYECTYEEYSGVEDAKRNKRLEKLPNSGTGANNTDSYTGENMNRKSKNTQNGY